MFPEKQRKASAVLRRGLVTDTIQIPHQAIVEFVAAVSKPVRGHMILTRNEALREARAMLDQFPVLYPNAALVRTAIECCSEHQVNWFDAHILAYAPHYGIPVILSEDFEHNRIYGCVRVVYPFSG